jgi:uncharacterized protein YeaO (DUF488 family)
MIRTRSVYSGKDPRRDGLRILAARFRGRGLAKDRYDIWMANLGPSERLLRQFQRGKVTWREFSRQYRKELFEDGSSQRRNRTIQNHGQKFTLRLLQMLARRQPITLLCHCTEAEQHCHRHLLQAILAGRI